MFQYMTAGDYLAKGGKKKTKSLHLEPPSETVTVGRVEVQTHTQPNPQALLQEDSVAAKAIAKAAQSWMDQSLAQAMAQPTVMGTSVNVEASTVAVAKPSNGDTVSKLLSQISNFAYLP